jgi:diguanylate cyclase (GGDEF)-like protein
VGAFVHLPILFLSGLVVTCALVILVLTMTLLVIGNERRALAQEALTDSLTGAFNRRGLDACLATAIERLQRTSEPASLAMFDVDHFKTFNDELGHAAGDEMLKALVRLVTGRARKLDVLFRVGGEEFVLLLSNARASDALHVADELRRLVAGAELVPGRTVSISVGVCELRRGETGAEWLRNADAALYRAKRAGRNRVAGAFIPIRRRPDPIPSLRPQANPARRRVVAIEARGLAYPEELSAEVVLPNRRRLRIRALRRFEDGPIRELYAHLSPRTRYMRFFSPMPTLPESVVQLLVRVDYYRSVSLVAESHDGDAAAIVGLGSFGAVDDRNVEIALVVRDDWQRQRVGTELVLRVMDAAESRGFRRFLATFRSENVAIRRLVAGVGDVVSARMSGGISELAFVRRLSLVH